LQQRQRAACGEGEVELGGEIPPAQVSALGAAHGARARHQAGQHRTGQRQIGAKSHAREGTNDGESMRLPGAQGGRPGKAGHGQQHGREPAARQPRATDQTQPQRQAQRSAHEIQRQEQRHLALPRT